MDKDRRHLLGALGALTVGGLAAGAIPGLTPGALAAPAKSGADMDKNVEEITLTSIPGILVGHATAEATGCTAILCPEGCTPGVHLPGFAPGSRETDLMRSDSLVEEVHGLLLTGGSAFGLAAADGIMRFLKEKGHGFAMPEGPVPIVPGAVIYDLDGGGQPPDASMGYQAARAASSKPVEQGRIGAGRGARCGRLFARNAADGTPVWRSSRGGLGSAGLRRAGVTVAALVVVNALGNVHHPETGQWLAGGVDREGLPLTEENMYEALSGKLPTSNTVLTVVATDAPMDKVGANRLARMAGAGLARSIRPAHLVFDGDIVFALAARPSEKTPVDKNLENLIGALGAAAVAKAAARAVIRGADTENVRPFLSW